MKFGSFSMFPAKDKFRNEVLPRDNVTTQGGRGTSTKKKSNNNSILTAASRVYSQICIFIRTPIREANSQGHPRRVSYVINTSM